jgi:hypothetical protein
MEKMEAPTHRILDTISAHLGEPLSINQLTEKIKEKYGNAHYSNTYKKTKELENIGALTIDSYGNSCIIRPNFENEITIDLLSEVEIEKKIAFLKEKNEFSDIFLTLRKRIDDICSIRSISSINSEKNSELNRLELLFLTREPGDYREYRTITCELYNRTKEIQEQYNLRIDSLILNESEFSFLISSKEINPLREAIGREITIFCPQAFWSTIKEISEKSEIVSIKTETKPYNIPEDDLTYNLNRFGYKEFGTKRSQGKKYCIEYIIISLLQSNEIRRLEAAPVMLAKNAFSPNLLTFLAQKYAATAKLLGILRTLRNIKPSEVIEETINLMENLTDKEEAPIDEESTIRNLRLYNVLH